MIIYWQEQKLFHDKIVRDLINPWIMGTGHFLWDKAAEELS
jgi:hypothetical protein